jgi:hypothetical protein
MRDHLSGWLIVAMGITVQFLLEVTLGRVYAAPAVVVPLLVYLSLSDSDYWAVEGALWSGLVMDLLLHHPPGVSSISMLLGIGFAGRLLRSTTGALEISFVFNAVLASLLSDLLFIFLAARPVGSEFGLNTLLILPRIIVVLLFYPGIAIVSGRRSRKY